MAPSIFIFSLSLPLLVVLLIFGLRYWSQVQQARLRFTNDEGYRQLASTAAATQAELATSLAALNLAVRDLQARMGAIEKVLKEVE